MNMKFSFIHQTLLVMGSQKWGMFWYVKSSTIEMNFSSKLLEIQHSLTQGLILVSTACTELAHTHILYVFIQHLFGVNLSSQVSQSSLTEHTTTYTHTQSTVNISIAQYSDYTSHTKLTFTSAFHLYLTFLTFKQPLFTLNDLSNFLYHFRSNDLCLLRGVVSSTT